MPCVALRSSTFAGGEKGADKYLQGDSGLGVGLHAGCALPQVIWTRKGLEGAAFCLQGLGRGTHTWSRRDTLKSEYHPLQGLRAERGDHQEPLFCRLPSCITLAKTPTIS